MSRSLKEVNNEKQLPRKWRN